MLNVKYAWELTPSLAKIIVHFIYSPRTIFDEDKFSWPAICAKLKGLDTIDININSPTLNCQLAISSVETKWADFIYYSIAIVVFAGCFFIVTFTLITPILPLMIYRILMRISDSFQLTYRLFRSKPSVLDDCCKSGPMDCTDDSTTGMAKHAASDKLIVSGDSTEFLDSFEFQFQIMKKIDLLHLILPIVYGNKLISSVLSSRKISDCVKLEIIESAFSSLPFASKQIIGYSDFEIAKKNINERAMKLRKKTPREILD